MKLLYSKEHFSCFNYSWNNSLIEFIEKKNERYEFDAQSNYLVLVCKGSIKFSSELKKEEDIDEGNMFIIPIHTKSIIKVPEKCTLVIMKINVDLSFCDHFSFSKLSAYTREDNKYIHTVAQNEIVKTYLKSLENYVSDGLRCVYFFELKIKELFFILRAYYTKESLAYLFQPILNKDMEFAEQISKHLSKTKTVKGLAELTHYSVSGFEKRFKRVFGIAANKWIQQNTSREIYREINCSNKTMTEIAYQFGFSPSHFNDYCKRVFKATPKQLRKKDTEGVKPKK